MSTVDVFKAPGMAYIQAIPAISQVDTFVAPSLKGLIYVPGISTLDTAVPPATAGGPINKYVKFPNLEGKHLSLKFYNDDPYGGLQLFYIRHKLLKFLDHNDHDAIQPNLEGTHLSVKITQSADEDFLLAYSSMTLLAYKE
jgi:hypothetical protein